MDPCQINMISYIPQTAPVIEKILKQVYGASLLDSPDTQSKLLYFGLYTPTRMIWENRTLEEWQDIRREFHDRDVLVPSEWNLSLPKVVTADQWTLYHIPGKTLTDNLE